MAQSTTYNPPSRPFLRAPSPSSLPTAEQHGLSGADAWAYNVSTRLMSDPGRWDLFNQVQAGMVWLDEYMKEIEDMVVKDDEEVDFVELVKTPGRNRAPQSHFNNTANAEKLARINALHFGEDLNEKPKEPKAEKDITVLPPSNTNNTLRPVRDDLHVVSHPPATPTPLAQETYTPLLPVPSKPAPAARQDQQQHHQQQQRPADPVPSSVVSIASTASVSSASGTSRASVAGASSTNARFGPRPLPTVPNGMRSRTASNASVMQPMRPPSRAATNPPSDLAPTVPQPKVMDFVEQPKIQTSAPKAKPALAPPRTPSPAPMESDDMEVEVPLNDTTVSLSTKPSAQASKPNSSGSTTTPAPIFPTTASLSRKPSFAALPNPSPMRKSVRGDTTTPHSRTSAATGATGQRTSGWFKGTTPAASTAAAADKKLLEKASGSKVPGGNASVLDTDEKTAANTAANAALTAAPAVQNALVAPVAITKKVTAAQSNTASSLKRKSDVLDGAHGSAASGTESAGEERPSKSTKKDGKTFAMDRDDEDDEDGQEGGEPHEDDTAERLLKLRGLLKAGGASDTGLPEKPRSRVDSRPGEFRPVSRAGASGDEATKIKSNEKKGKNTKPVIVSPLKVSELVGAWEKKGEASPSVDRKPMTPGVDSGFGLPKFAPLAKAQISTTPPESPAAHKLKTFTTTTTKASVKTLERVSSAPAQPGASIFKAPPKTNIFTAPTGKPASQGAAKPSNQGIFTRPASQQPAASSQPSQSQEYSQSTITTNDEDTDPLFEMGKKGKTSSSTFDTQSQPSQEPYKAKDREPTVTWGMEEGLTAGWLSKGNDTLGENAARQRAAAQDEDDDESEHAFIEEDVTDHHAVAAIMAHAMAESHRVDGDDAQEESDDEMVVDSQDEDELEKEDEPMQEEEEEEEEVALPPPPVSVGGIFAQVGSFASKAAFGFKSLRPAAPAPEKEKTAQEKRDARIQEAKVQRQAIARKKAEEDAKKREELDRKRKADEERRKKEKADTTLNRSIKTKPMVPVSEKKPELKKVPSKIGLNNSTLGPSKIAQPSMSKRAPTPTKAPTIKLIGQQNSSSAAAALHSAPPPLRSILGAPTTKPTTNVTFQANSSLALKANLMAANGSTSSLLSSKQQTTQVQAQVSASTSAHARVSEGGIDEGEDLPDIKSEYSDSEDEDRPKTYDPPIWAQSPDLRQALEDMRRVNPDTIFGAMPQLRMEEIFPNNRRKSKFRARTSSANWAGTDGVTIEEEMEYAKRMGFERIE